MSMILTHSPCEGWQQRTQLGSAALRCSSAPQGFKIKHRCVHPPSLGKGNFSGPIGKFGSLPLVTDPSLPLGRAHSSDRSLGWRNLSQKLCGFGNPFSYLLWLERALGSEGLDCCLPETQPTDVWFRDVCVPLLSRSHVSYKFILLPLTLSRGDRRTSCEDSCKQVTVTAQGGRELGRLCSANSLLIIPSFFLSELEPLPGCWCHVLMLCAEQPWVAAALLSSLSAPVDAGASLGLLLQEEGRASPQGLLV